MLFRSAEKDSVDKGSLVHLRLVSETVEKNVPLANLLRNDGFVFHRLDEDEDD